MRYMARAALAALLLVVALWGAHAQEYPAKPIVLLCWSEPGSPVDVFARMLGRLLSRELRQNIVVDNRTGADGIIMVNYLLRQPADGYTIAANTLTLATLFSEPQANFKPADLQLIARSQIDPYGLMVPASIPFKTIDEFAKYARANPGKINVGGPFQMSAHRVAWEVFSELAKIKTTWIPYKGGGPVLIAVSGGHVDAAHTNPGNAKHLISAGKIRVLAVSSDKRLEDFPDVPTYKERGWDVVRYQWRGIMGRSGLPQPVIDRLLAAIQKSQQTQEWKDYLAKVSQLDGFLSPSEFRSQLMQDIQEIESVKKKLGL